MVGCGSLSEKLEGTAEKLLELGSLLAHSITFIFPVTGYPGMENNLPQTMIVISLAKTKGNIGIFPCICHEVFLQ